MNTNATWTPASYEPSLREKIKHLLSYHSSADVYSTLMEVFQEEYGFYQTLFQVPQQKQQPPQQQQQPQPAQKVRGDIRIRVVKKSEQEETIEKAIEIQPQPLNVDTLPDVPQEEESQPTHEKEKKARIKREQTAAEQKKFQELKSKGIHPETLLTKENLNTWVNAQGLTFTQIARDHVGIDAEKISEVAKGFGLQSSIAKKRAQILAAKRGGK